MICHAATQVYVLFLYFSLGPEIPLESTRIGRLSHATDDAFDMSTMVDDRLAVETASESIQSTVTEHSAQNQTASISADATPTANGTAGPALDASFDLTVHGEAEDEEVVEQ